MEPHVWIYAIMKKQQGKHLTQEETFVLYVKKVQMIEHPITLTQLILKVVEIT